MPSPSGSSPSGSRPKGSNDDKAYTLALAVQVFAHPEQPERIKAANLVGAATLGLAVRSALYMYTPGLTAWVQETDSELTVTARAPDGSSSGWAGQASRDWAAIKPSAVAAHAIEVADRSRNGLALEPGRRTAILSPAAVAQLVRLMAPMYDADQTDRGRTPFSYHGANGKTNKLGLRVFDPQLTLVSDPADPAGGFPPFFEADSKIGIPGLSLPKMTWVEGGILKNLAYSTLYALAKGKPWCEYPYAVRLEPTPGATTATLEEMIAACKDAVYVSRLSDVSVVDPKTGVMTGVTRDGCFHVKDGKIDKPLKNFRFTESPLFVFNKVRMIGTPERAALGYTAPSPREFGSGYASWPPRGRATRWPRAPIVVPAMVIEDFSFTALADAL